MAIDRECELLGRQVHVSSLVMTMQEGPWKVAEMVDVCCPMREPFLKYHVVLAGRTVHYGRVDQVSSESESSPILTRVCDFMYIIDRGLILHQITIKAPFSTNRPTTMRHSSPDWWSMPPPNKEFVEIRASREVLRSYCTASAALPRHQNQIENRGRLKMSKFTLYSPGIHDSFHDPCIA